MNIDGSSPQLLTNVEGTASSPIITPDTNTVLFAWVKNDQLVSGKIPLGGGAIAEQPHFTRNHWMLSPDGKQIAFAFYDEPAKRYKVRVRPLETEEPSPIFDISPTNFLVWTADGKHLLYRKLGPSQASNSTIWMQAVSGGEPKSFLSVKPDSVYNLSQSGDGKQTAVVRGKLLTDAVMLTKITQTK